MEEKLREMENMAIDVAVLSHGLPFGPDVLRGHEADEWAARINDDLARIISEYPGKFVGLGAVGFGDRRRSLAEVDRCVRQLGFRGFQIFSNISGKLLDSPEVTAVLRHIGTLGVPIHLHPAIPLNCVGLDTPANFLSLGFPYDSSLNVLRLIQTGLLDESPNLNVIVAHVGGVLPYLAGRIGTYSAPSELVPEGTRLAHALDHDIRRLYVDTVCYNIEALECCYKVVGAEHMLFATDHPFGRFEIICSLVDELKCPAADRELIFHGNAERLLNLKQLPPPLENCGSKEKP
jgi:predicted TIM-barrel fold metal-dependent hydrolase